MDLYERSITVKTPEPLRIQRFPISVIPTASGEKYHNLYTGKVSMCLEDVKEEGKEYQLFPQKENKKLGVGMQFDESLGMVSVVLCIINTSRPKKCQQQNPRMWKEIDRIYISKEKTVFARNVCFSIFLKEQKITQNCFDPSPSYSSRYFLTEGGEVAQATDEGCSLLDCKEKDPLMYHFQDKEVYHEYALTASILFGYSGGKTIMPINAANLAGGERYSWETKDFVMPLRKLFGNFLPLKENQMICLDSMENFILYCKKGIKKNKKTACTLPELPSVDIVKTAAELKHFPPSDQNLCKRIAIIQSLDEKNVVIRFFFLSPSGEAEEGSRMYVSDKKAVMYKKLDGSFIRVKMGNHAYNFDMPLVAFDKSILKGTNLQYFGDIIEELPDWMKMTALWAFMRYPIIEKMYKIPYLKKTVILAFFISHSSPIEALCSIFKIVYSSNNQWDKENNVYKALKMNKHQLKLVAQLIENYGVSFIYREDKTPWFSHFPSTLFRYIAKLVAAGEDIFSIDENTNQKIAQICQKGAEIYNERYTVDQLIESLEEQKITLRIQMKNCLVSDCYESRFQFTIGSLCDTYSIHVAEKMAAWVAEMTVKDPRAVDIFRDTIRMIEDTGLAAQIKPPFRDFSFVMELHDSLMHVLQSRKEEYEIKRFNEQKKKWCQLHYADESFSILSPDTPEEIVCEGAALNHCVKMYVQRVISGSTNILFLRNNDNLEKPFFTIEVDNNRMIQQVHGMNNSCAPEQVGDFLKKWAKKKDLKISDYNKVR